MLIYIRVKKKPTLIDRMGFVLKVVIFKTKSVVIFFQVEGTGCNSKTDPYFKASPILS